MASRSFNSSLRAAKGARPLWSACGQNSETSWTLQMAHIWRFQPWLPSFVSLPVSPSNSSRTVSLSPGKTPPLLQWPRAPSISERSISRNETPYITWGGPKTAVPPNHPFQRVFLYEPEIFGYPPWMETPHLQRAFLHHVHYRERFSDMSTSSQLSTAEML